MESTTYAGLPVPEPHEADLMPYWISLLCEKLDATTVLTAASAYDRDVKYTNAPAGVLVVSDPATTVTALWLKTGGPGVASWATVWETVPAGQQWFPPLAITSDWADLSLTNPYVAPFRFMYDEKTDTVLIRGALYKTLPWVQGQIIAHVPASMVPTYACGWVGSAYNSTAVVGSGEIRQGTGEIRLWKWALHQGESSTPSDAALWFDGTSYRKGDMT